MNQGEFFFFFLSQCPSQSGKATIGSHSEFFRDFRRVGAGTFTRMWVPEYPSQPLENELQRGCTGGKEDSSGQDEALDSSDCHCKHSLYWQCRAYCQWPVGIGFPGAQEIHFSSEGERSDSSWSSPEELWQMCHSNLTAPRKNINSEGCWFLQAYFTPLST